MGNWNAPQTVTVTVAIDQDNSDNAFANQTVSVTTVDDDGVGFTIVESGGNTSVNESGAADTFTVVLTSEPLGDVVLDVVSGDTGEATVSPASLTFDASNWDTPQTVTGVDDVAVDGSQTTAITVSIDSALTDDALYDTLLVQGNSNPFINESQTFGVGTDTHSEFEHGTLSGGTGNNRLDARFANFPVTLLGNEGRDTLLGSSRGDRLDGGAGIDFAEIVGANITLTNSNAPGMDIDTVISVEGLLLIAANSGSTIDASAYTLGSVTIIGSSGKDTLKGGSGDDFIFAGGGADDVSGGDGNDLILAGTGADVVSGGAGDDLISGGGGNDSISGDEGNDIVFGGAGRDLIDGGAGTDDLFGGRNADTIRGGDDDDFLFGSQGRDILDGEGGHDTLFGGSGRDSLFGGLGNDFLNGVLRNDGFLQQVGQDTLNGGGAAPQSRPANIVAKQVPETAQTQLPKATAASDQNEIDSLFSDPLSIDLALL